MTDTIILFFVIIALLVFIVIAERRHFAERRHMLNLLQSKSLSEFVVMQKATDTPHAPKSAADERIKGHPQPLGL